MDKTVALLIPACKSSSSNYLKNFIKSIIDHSIDVFSSIFILAQGYSEEEIYEIIRMIPYQKLNLVSGDKGEFGSRISEIREYMRTNCPVADYYVVVDDDMLHNEGSAEYIKSCIEVLESRPDAVVACMTKSWRKCDTGVPYVLLNSWNNVDMLNGILVKSEYFLNEFSYDSRMIVGEDTSMFIEAFLSGHAMLKFYNAPMIHIRSEKPDGLTNYYKSNSAELMTNDKTSLTKYKSDGILKMRPKVFTEKAIAIHKSNYYSKYSKYPDYLGKYDI